MEEAGRQGDPGESRFYIALDDDLMKIFGGDMVSHVYNTLGADENMPLEAGILSKQVESAQKRVEGKNFSIRKHVLQYDDVMNNQREIIYGERRQVLDGENLKPKILHMIEEEAGEVVRSYTAGLENTSDINKAGLLMESEIIFGIKNLDSMQGDKINENAVIEELTNRALEKYEQKEKEIGENELRELERVVMLKVVDDKWMNHIDNMDELKDGIGLRAYGQKDPVVQYRIEGFEMFDQMISDIKTDVVKLLMNLRKAENTQRTSNVKITSAGLEGPKDPTANPSSESKPQPVVNKDKQIGRNDPCPCGSRQEI